MIHIYCGAGHDVEKIQQFKEEGIIQKYYQLIKENNIHLHRWILTWKTEKNADIHTIVRNQYQERIDNN